MSSPAPRLLPAAFPLSLLSLLSAFLLFQVQPVISKFILPWFGGSPGVWTTCMVFFQCVLFAGYAYAHALTRLRPRTQAVLHTLLMLAALALLPIAPGDAWKPAGDEDPAGRILLLLLATVGLPYFILSSTSPLTQVWFTRMVPGGTPWRLYALSNVGSLAALLSYPFFFEPLLDVGTQTWLWSGAFVVFALLSIALVWRASRADAAPDTPAGEKTGVLVQAPAAASAPVLWRHRLLWVVLPALASAMLLATTNHVCQDVAVVPFMWVVPLSLYLLTFIICFEHERWYVRGLWAGLGLVVIFITAAEVPLGLKLGIDFTPNYLAEIAWCFSALFLACMVCHGELARLKPAPERLTEFYLLMSAGGALGGMAVSLVAPRVFVTFMEWPLGLIACVMAAGAALLGAAVMLPNTQARIVLGALVLGVTGAMCAYLTEKTTSVSQRLERVRNFYGVMDVDSDYDSGLDSEYHTLTHGGIVHGMQNLSDAYRQEPVTYYGRETGIGKALTSLKDRPDAHVGVVGLGAGTVACYAQAAQSYRFYDINPDVVRLARKHFTYLADAERRGATVDTVIGDARLMLEREPNQQFDLLLLDAFSGDAIPMHLLTREAFQIYQRHMKPGGIIAVHVTNSYLILAPVVEKQAEALGWRTTRLITEEDGDDDSTDYVLITQNEDFLKNHPADSPIDEPVVQVPLWTDRYHNLFQILLME